jgi:competence protein ComEC
MLQRTFSGPDLRGLTLIFVASAWLAGILLDSFLLLPSLALLIAAGAAFASMLLLRYDTQGRLIALLIACLFLGAWRYTSASPSDDPQAIRHFIGLHSLTIRGNVSDEPKLEGRSRILLITVSSMQRGSNSALQDVHGQLEALTLGAGIETPYGPNYGDSVELQGTLQPAPPHSPPGVFASMAFPRIHVDSNGGNALLAFLYHLRVTLATILSQSLPQPEAGLLIAILLSLRTPPLALLTQYFNVTGTAHMIAPSGFKVTLLAGLVVGGTQWLSNNQRQRRKLLPAQKHRDWGYWLSTILVIFSIAVYTLLSGAVPAALRAGVMGSLLVLAPRIGRVYNLYTAMALTAIVMSVIDPFVLWDTGFLLSFLGTLGIVLLTPFFQGLLSPLEHLPFGHSITEIVAVTLAAQVATLPIFAVTFQEISFIAPIANMLTVPLLSTLIFLGIVISATGLLSIPLASIYGWVAHPLLWYMTTIVQWCAHIPYAYIGVSTINDNLAWGYYLLLAIGVSVVLSKETIQQSQHKQHSSSLIPGFSRRTWRIAQLSAALLTIAATGTTVLATQSDGHLTITFLNVGPTGQPSQGEAILIRTADGKTALIDGGPDAASLAQELDSLLPSWQRSLNLVILTTPRSDTLTGLQDIVQRYQIGEVVDAGMLHPTSAYALWRHTIAQRNLTYKQVSQGTVIALGTQVVLQVLWPAHLHKGSNEDRDNGLILRLVTPGLRILLLGATAQSKYALTGVTTTFASNYLQAEIVQIVGEVDKPFLTELGTVLQQAHPSWLVITPASLSAKQRKTAGISTIIRSVSPLLSAGNWQVVQTAQQGTIEIDADNGEWSMGQVSF